MTDYLIDMLNTCKQSGELKQPEPETSDSTSIGRKTNENMKK